MFPEKCILKALLRQAVEFFANFVSKRQTMSMTRFPPACRKQPNLSYHLILWNLLNQVSHLKHSHLLQYLPFV